MYEKTTYKRQWLDPFLKLAHVEATGCTSLANVRTENCFQKLGLKFCQNT
jgi:hypothetical protein